MHKRKYKVSLSSLCPQESAVLATDANELATAGDMEQDNVCPDADETKHKSAEYYSDSSTSDDSLESVSEDDGGSSSDELEADSDAGQVFVFTTKKYLPRDKAARTEWMLQALNKKVHCNRSF